MRRSVVARGIVLAAVLLAAYGPAPASAGTYTVVGGCRNNWIPHPGAPGYTTVYGECPGLVVRHVGGPFTTPWGILAYWEFLPPSGASVSAVSMSGTLTGRKGWQASIMADEGLVLERCPSATCPTGSKAYSIDIPFSGRSQLTVSVWCLKGPKDPYCPNNDGLNGYADARNIVVTIADSTAPAVDITGGNLLAGWRRLQGAVSLRATDNVGIKMDRLLVDGVTREQRARACAWGTRIPCPNGTAGLTLDTTRLADGPHTLTVQAIDSANNIGSQSTVVRVDNTAPTAPSRIAVAGGLGWRTSNAFSLSWENPPQSQAPIAAVHYRLCPLANAPTKPRGCITGARPATDVHALTNLAVPGLGAWRARFWLVDAAGNENPAAAGETVLRFDNTPPTVVFHKPLSTDPARVRVTAHDSVSQTASVAIEARRRGDNAWQELPTQRRLDQFAAFVDDERLPRGAYDLRAMAVDAAGNERLSSARDDGRPAVMTLPVRQRATLVVGLRTRRCARHRGCRERFATAPVFDFGSPVRLRGRLRVGGRPTSAPIEVWRRVSTPTATWERVGTIRSSRAGAVRYAAPLGPSRRFRFRFGGTPTARGAAAVVNAGVRAATTIDVSRRDLVNGEYVTFRGKVRGNYRPATGKLVELQVFTRRRWRTFALPRADARTGRWSFQYRFETISGLARFRFRARIQREAGYPFQAGTSRQIRVTVRGI